MRTRTCFVITFVVLAMVVPGFAGEKTAKTCAAPASECQKKLTQDLAHRAWLGIEMKATEDGYYRITGVVEGSPAEKAGFKTGDVLIAMDGQEYSKNNVKSVKKAWSALKPGMTSKYLVVRGDGQLELEAKLGHMPKELQEKIIKKHMQVYHSES